MFSPWLRKVVQTRRRITDQPLRLRMARYCKVRNTSCRSLRWVFFIFGTETDSSMIRWKATELSRNGVMSHKGQHIPTWTTTSTLFFLEGVLQYEEVHTSYNYGGGTARTPFCFRPGESESKEKESGQEQAKVLMVSPVSLARSSAGFRRFRLLEGQAQILSIILDHF